jgi:hypothetical protein
MKTRKILSERELISYSKQHLFYEISMMRGAAHLLGKQFRTESPELGMVLRNTLVESFAIHLRNLIDFLYPEKIWDTDVLADDFFPQGKRPVGFPLLPIQLENARKRAHKQVSRCAGAKLEASYSTSKFWKICQHKVKISRPPPGFWVLRSVFDCHQFCHHF